MVMVNESFVCVGDGDSGVLKQQLTCKFDGESDKKILQNCSLSETSF